MTRSDKPKTVELASVRLTQNTVYFKINCDFVDHHDKARVYYSLDGHEWKPIGEAVKLLFGGTHLMG